MHVDALAVLLALVAAGTTRTKAALVVALHYLGLWVLIYFFIVPSPYWHVGYLPEFHLLSAAANALGLAVLCAVSKSFHVVKLAGAALVLLNLSVFYASRVTMLESAAVAAFPFLRLALIAAQLTGLFYVGLSGKNGKRRRASARDYSINFIRRRYALSFTESHKRA